jgi:integrase
LTIQEDGLICLNAFSKTFIPREVGVKRVPVSPDDIERVQRICLGVADERRLLVALISDTGMRLTEALGLIWSDFKLDHE